MKKELRYDDIEDMFNHHKDWENDLLDSKKLSSIDKNLSINLIIKKLESSETSIRYIASHMIITFKIEKRNKS